MMSATSRMPLGNARDMDIQIAELTQLYNDELDPKYKPGYGRLLLRLKTTPDQSSKKDQQNHL